MTSTNIRNRIKAHRRVRAGDLVPHELNYRYHPENQRAVLDTLYREIGFARSLLRYELPDGKLKLIDGHLRRDMDPDMEVDVEILWQETQSSINAALGEKPVKKASHPIDLEAQYLVVVTCRDEKHQVELLQRFQQEGLTCKALLS